MRASHRKAWKRKAWTWKVWEHKFLFVEGRQEVGTEAVPEYIVGSCPSLQKANMSEWTSVGGTASVCRGANSIAL